MTTKSFTIVAGQMRKMPGWHSWRHATNAEQNASRERYQHESGPAARRRRAIERQDDNYTPVQTWDATAKCWVK